jgi:hypothetical protein
MLYFFAYLLNPARRRVHVDEIVSDLDICNGSISDISSSDSDCEINYAIASGYERGTSDSGIVTEVIEVCIWLQVTDSGL